MRNFLPLICLLFAIYGCNPTEKNNGHQEPGLLDSNQMGINLLEAALEKHGDLYSSSEDIAFEVICDRYVHPTQSQRPFMPMIPGFWERQISLSPKNETEVHHSKMKAGSYLFNTVAILKDDERISYSINTKTYEKNNFEYIRNLDVIPQTYLRKALENRASVKLVPNPEKDSTQAIDVFFDDRQHRLWIARDTILRKVENLRHSPTYGLGVQTHVFRYNGRMKGCLIPFEVVSIYANEVWNKVENTFRICPVGVSVDKYLKETADYKHAEHTCRRKAEVITLVDNIYLIENVTSSSRFWSYNILFAEFSDYVLVAEAPVNNNISRLVMEKIREIVPDKPVRFIVQSHHHSDHIAGIKEYIDQGVTIVTTPKTSEVIEKVNGAYRYGDKETEPPQFKIVKEALTLQDNKMKVKIIDLGPTLHSEEMLVTYFSDSGIMFQADLVNYGEWPIDIDISVEFAEKVKALGLSIDMIVGLHGRVMMKDEVERFLEGTLTNKFDR